jgi:hypothetical protein
MEKLQPKQPLAMHPAFEKEASLAGSGLKFGLKRIPYLGSLVNLYSAASRFGAGDYLGTGLDLGSAVFNTIPVIGNAASLGLDSINLIRDISNAREEIPTEDRFSDLKQDNLIAGGDRFQDLKDDNFMRDTMKTAASQFQQDINNPTAGLESDLYKSIAPVISSEDEEAMPPGDLARTNNLKDQVRKGLVGLEYLTGLKSNKGETFYDKHPGYAVGSDLAKNAPLLGAAVGGTMLGTNLLRQWSNMRKTEPAKMSRSENPLDRTNPANLLDSSGEHSRLFGDLEGNLEQRLGILDRLNNKTNADDAFLKRHKDLSLAKNNAIAANEQQFNLLKDTLSKTTDRKELAKLESMMRAQSQAHAQDLAKYDKAIKGLVEEAKASSGNSGLRKYVNLSESLRRANEKGGLKQMIGEGLGSFGGIADLAEKYHITGANPHFDRELLQNIAMEHAGSRASANQVERFLNKIVPQLADQKHQASGLSKAFSRAKLPLLTGAGIAAGGYGLYNLLKSMQEQTYAKPQLEEWKKNLRHSRGDFSDEETQQESPSAQPVYKEY